MHTRYLKFMKYLSGKVQLEKFDTNFQDGQNSHSKIVC